MNILNTMTVYVVDLVLTFQGAKHTLKHLHEHVP